MNASRSAAAFAASLLMLGKSTTHDFLHGQQHPTAMGMLTKSRRWLRSLPVQRRRTSPART